MQIVIDTREKLPWEFGPSIETVSEKLDAGDYKLVHPSINALIERKSEADLVNTLTHHAKRFRLELERLREADYACVVVESGVAGLLDHGYRSEISPAAVLDRVMNVVLDQEVPVFFTGDRIGAVAFAEAWFRRVQRRGG